MAVATIPWITLTVTFDHNFDQSKIRSYFVVDYLFYLKQKKVAHSLPRAPWNSNVVSSLPFSMVKIQ